LYFLDQLTLSLGSSTARKWFEDQQSRCDESSLYSTHSSGGQPSISRSWSQDLGDCWADGVAESYTRGRVRGRRWSEISTGCVDVSEHCPSSHSLSERLAVQGLVLRLRRSERSFSSSSSASSSSASASSKSPTGYSRPHARDRPRTSTQLVKEGFTSPRQAMQAHSPVRTSYSPDARRVERMLQTGGENAGLIFTDAAHAVLHRCGSGSARF
jgi:hypothetical protein